MAAARVVVLAAGARCRRLAGRAVWYVFAAAWGVMGAWAALSAASVYRGVAALVMFAAVLSVFVVFGLGAAGYVLYLLMQRPGGADGGGDGW